MKMYFSRSEVSCTHRLHRDKSRISGIAFVLATLMVGSQLFSVNAADVRVSSGCPAGVRTRIPIYDLNKDDIADLKDGFVKLYRDGVLQRFVNLHRENSKNIHSYVFIYACTLVKHMAPGYFHNFSSYTLTFHFHFFLGIRMQYLVISTLSSLNVNRF
jgi:hypothetical protein